MTIVRIDRPDYIEPLFYYFDKEYQDVIDMICDGIERGLPQMITTEEKEDET